MPAIFEDPYYFVLTITTIVLLSQITAIAIVALMLFSKNKKESALLQFLYDKSTILAFIVALAAFASSMTFSDVFDMVPCKLCVYQRIVIFPQVIILGVALWKKHHDLVTDYSLALAAFAIPLSIFHYMLQMTDAPSVHQFAPCDVTGQAPSCSGYYVIQYGFITIPMMALTASTLIVILMIIRKKFRS